MTVQKTYIKMNIKKRNKVKPTPIGKPMLSLTLLFIILKIFGAIDWSWIWVFSPLWLPVVFGFSVILGVIILVILFDTN